MLADGVLVGRVSEIRRYPVKSMLGDSLSSVDVTWTGLVGDHRLAIVHDDVVLTAKQRVGAPLLTCAAQMHDLAAGWPGYWIQVPEPYEQEGWYTDSAVVEALGGLLGRSVEIASFGAREPLTRPTTARFPTRAGTFVDSSPLHIVTSASLRLAQSAGVDHAVRRFRPQIVVTTEDGEQPLAEARWVGRCLRIGDEVTVMIRKATERCSMPGREQYEMPANLEVHTWLRKNTGNNFGVYAVVVNPGRIKLSDPMVLL